MSVNTQQPRASFNATVASLNPGESCAKVRALDPAITVADIPNEMPRVRLQLRNATMSAVSRATCATGNQYSIQVGESVMPGGNIFVVAVVTRKE